MAFVSCTERNFDPAFNTPTLVGPGSYENPINKHN